MKRKKNKAEKISSKLYLKVAIVIYLFFQAFIFIVSLIFYIISRTPLGDYAIIDTRFISITMTCSIVIGIGILSGFISYVVAKKVLSPLVELSAKSKEVAKGNFNVHVSEDSGIYELQNSLHNFNLMVDELSKVDTLSNSFVANVSHEFKTPLAVIRSYVNILENSDLSEEERKNYLHQIDQSISKLSDLVSNVLKICKIDSQQVKPENKAYRLDEQLRQCILTYSERIEDKKLELDINLEDISVSNDESLMDQVFNNILSNAIKFSPEGGTIHISGKASSEGVSISIRDHGPGMDEETKARIFDRFYQGETSHSKEGNGLGLSIVQLICRICNVTISVNSEPGQGSEFILTFPNSMIIETNS